MTALELPPELWVQIYNALATLSDSHLELATYLLICKLSHSSLYPRLFETIHVPFGHSYIFLEWIRTHGQTLAHATKRAHIRWEAEADLIILIFEACPQLERVAYWGNVDTFENLEIARALTSLPNLIFLQLNVLQLSFLFSRRSELSGCFLQIEKLCIHFWDNYRSLDAVKALKSIDFSLFKSLTRLNLTMDRETQTIVSTLLTLQLPFSLKVIVIVEDGNSWTTTPSHSNDPRIVYFRQVIFDTVTILSASAAIRESPEYDANEYPFDDWGEITSSKEQSIWLWAEEAVKEGKAIFSRPV
ncbi:hypothetical protein DL96DRAFT_1595562 [Flagelloscypha sp. PMI_526]|nr:hypothetical protein DL96DRAFT_1595562 [Flagelloscypha sp. PMI_526]